MRSELGASPDCVERSGEQQQQQNKRKEWGKLHGELTEVPRTES